MKQLQIRGHLAALAIAVVIATTSAAPAPAATYTTIATFPDGSGYSEPAGSLLAATDGNFYSNLSNGSSSAAFFQLAGGTFSETSYGIFVLTGEPLPGYIEGPDGNLYGADSDGVFNIAPPYNSSSVTVLYIGSPFAFTGSVSSLTRGVDGNYYGTASAGGAHSDGFAYMITPTGTFTDIYDFGATGSDGITPIGALCQGIDGFLYGTTEFGGAASAGTLFKMNTAGGGYAILHSFGVGSDGKNPTGGLVQVSGGGFNGYVFGTTMNGGTKGKGTVFAAETGRYNQLHNFGSTGTDGTYPLAGLLIASDGNLYGTTSAGGLGGGTIYSIGPVGTGYASLYELGTAPTDGSLPSAPLTQGPDGTLYGTTASGGADAGGTAFSYSNGLSALVGISSLTLSTAEIIGGHSLKGTVTLTGVTSKNLKVQLANSNPNATAPGTVTVEAGFSTASFTITTTLPGSQTSGSISALVNSTLKSATLKVDPLVNSFKVVPQLEKSGNISIGHPFNFTITAFTPGNTVDNSYAGNVAFSDTDPLASIPGVFPVSGGTGTFSATLKTRGRSTLTASNSATPTITGSVLINAVGFTVGGVGKVVVQQGNVTSATVTVSPDRNYLGTITLSAPSLPAGWSGQFAPSSVVEKGISDAPSSVTMLIRAPSTASVGANTLPIEGTSGTAIVSGTVPITVKATSVLTSIVVTPTNPSVSPSATQQFSAIAYDQNGIAMSPQPSFTWSKAGDGSISASGLYTAGTAAGSCTVTASASRVNGSTTVTVP